MRSRAVEGIVTPPGKQNSESLNEDRLSFRILGTLEILLRERRVRIGGSRQSKVLALLLLNARRVVSVERLIEAVWDDTAPASARGQIAICVSQVRSSLREVAGTDDVIVTRPTGYLLQVADEQVDASVFAARMARASVVAKAGRLAEAAAMMRSALAIWRGPALAGVTGLVIRAEAARLDESRLSALQDCIAVELELCLHEQLIGELTALVAEHPLHEHLRAQLMVALYRSGRRAEALATYHEGRRMLIDELGIEPGPKLQSVHEEVLHDTVAMGVPSQPGTGTWVSGARQPMRYVPAQLPPDVSEFVGREQELAALDRLLDCVADEASLTIGLVTGVGGVGKTGLVLHWAHRTARSFPDGQLFIDLQGYDRSGEPLEPGTVLERFLRALGVPGDRVPAHPDERAALFRSQLDGRRVLVVLDNARSADQVRPLLPGSSSSCVIVTSRSSLDDLVIRLGAQRLALTVLRHEDAIALLSATAGADRIRADPVSVARIADLCDRLPLALRVAAVRLAARPHWTLGKFVVRLSDQRRRLDELSEGDAQIRANFWLGYRDLPPDAARMYRRLGLLDIPDFVPWVGAALLDIGTNEAEDLVEQLVDAQLLEVRGRDATGEVRYHFHDLLRLYAAERCEAEDSPEDRLAALARAFGCLMALVEEAHRREYGGDYTLIHGSAPRWRPEADVVNWLLRNPLQWLSAERLTILSAIRQAGSLELHELCWDMAHTATTLFENGNWQGDWLATCDWALKATRKAGNIRGEAATLYSLATLRMSQHRYTDAFDMFGVALALFERADDRHGYALALRNVAWLNGVNGDFGTAITRYEHARATFREVGDRGAEAHVLSNMARIELERGKIAASKRLIEDAVSISRAIGNHRTESQALYLLGEMFLAEGQHDKAQDTFGEVLSRVREHDDAVGMAHAFLGLGETQMGQGRFKEAEASLQASLRSAGEVTDRLVEARACLVLGKLAAVQADPSQAISHFRAALRLFGQIQAPLWRARTLLVLGESERSLGNIAAAQRAWTEARSLFAGMESSEAENVEKATALLAEVADQSQLGIVPHLSAVGCG